MVLAYHAIFCCYGFWLPNDPRGSWSDFVRSWELYWFGGPATKTTARESLAHRPHDVARRLQAKACLRYPAVSFDGLQAQAVGVAFVEFARKSDLAIYACSIMPQHVHLVIRRHRYPIEGVVNKLKGAATTALLKAGRHPLVDCRNRQGRMPSPWADDCWKVFLSEDADIHRSIDYVERNPVREGHRAQQWTCVRPYPGIGAIFDVVLPQLRPSGGR